MIDVGRVRGSAEMARPLVVGKTTVYEHSNIIQITEVEGIAVKNLYEYDEVQYSISEYIALQEEKRTEVESMVDDLMTNIIPELIGG